jgi:hypothetical protein
VKHRIANHFVLAVLAVATLIAVLFGCDNPLVSQMRDEIIDDVETYLAGEKPTVLSVSPVADAPAVSTSATIVVTFDIALDPETLTGENVQLIRLSGEVDVPGTIDYDDDTHAVTFTPDDRLDVATTYRLTVTTAVTSAEGAKLAAAFVTEFTTQFFHDDEIALVLSYASADFDLTSSAPIIVGLLSVPQPETPDPPEDYITELTSSPIIAESTVRIPQSAIPQESAEAVVYLYHDINNNGSYDGPPDTRLYVRTGVAGNMDDGAALYDDPPYVGEFANFTAAYVLSVGTSYAINYVEGEQPAVVSVTPTNGSTGLPTSTSVVVTFDMGLDPATVTSDNVQLLPISGGVEVPATLDYNNVTHTVTITPSAWLDVNTTYQVRITTSVTSAEGIGLPTEFTSQFATRYFHDDEIGLMLSYSSDIFELNADAPMGIILFTVPLPYPPDPPEDYMTILSGSPVTGEGPIRIAQSDIPQGTETAIVGLFHDHNNNGNPDGVEETYYVVLGAPGNLGGEGMLMAGEPVGGYYNFNPDAVITVGNGYDVTYVEESPYDPDGFEGGDDAGPAASRLLEQGVNETARNLDVPDDVDFFRFTPATTDSYQIRVMETDYEITISLYDNDSDALTGVGGYHLSLGTGSAERIVNPDGTLLTGGHEYYLRVESLEGGLGPYELGYTWTPVDPDGNEDTDDVKGGATPLPLGVGSPVTATLDAYDSDWFEIELETANTYVLDVQEDPSCFGFGAEERGLELYFRIERAPDTSSTAIYWEMDETTLFIGDPDGWSSDPGDDGTGTYYVQIQNQTPQVGSDQPTAQYTISLTYGPDSADRLDNPYSGENDYDLWNEHGPAGYNVSPYLKLGTKGGVRTIYTVEPGVEPQEDVDWFSFTVGSIYNEYLIIVEPAGPVDGITVDYIIYPNMIDGSDSVPDTSSPVMGGSAWPSDETIRGGTLYPLTARDYEDPADPIIIPTNAERRWWIGVSRAGTPGNVPTGRYRIRVLAAPDSEDNYYVSPEEPDVEVEMIDADGEVFFIGGIDETPFLGIRNQQTGGQTFETRNLLEWSASPYEIDTVYNSIYRKNYAGLIGEPDGVTDPSVDHEFYWFQLPTAVGNFVLLAISDSTPNIPFTFSYWEITAAQFEALKDDEVITEVELNETATPVVIDSGFIEMYQEERIESTIMPSDIDHYFFFKVQRDDDRATYTDQYGTVWDYAPHGQYRFMFFD